MVRRGEVWWVDFGDPVGSEPGYRRPAVVVSADRFNRSRIRTVMVAALTTSMRLAMMPGNVELAVGDAGVPKACVVNVTQTLVVDRDRLVEPVGVLTARLMDQVDVGLRLVLAL